MSVKGPRLPHMVVQVAHPRRWQLNLAILLAVMAVACMLAYYAGRHMTLRNLANHGDEEKLPQLEQLLDENAALRDEVAVFRGGGDVSRQVEERVRTNNRELQDRVAELEEAIAYYRRVDVSDRSGKGLRVDNLNLASVGAPSVWMLKMLLVRTGEIDGIVEGHLEGQLLAQGPAGPVELPLAQLLAVDQQQFRVRYVEDRKMEFRLPPGLSPVRLDIVVVLTAPRAARIEQFWPQAVKKPRPPLPPPTEPLQSPQPPQQIQQSQAKQSQIQQPQIQQEVPPHAGQG